MIKVTMNQINSPTKTNIQEANKHLQMLHGRVEQLERALSKQANDFAQRESDRQIHFEELIKIRDAEISTLRERLINADANVSEMKETLKEKNQHIDELNDKARVLDEVVQCKPILESLVNLMTVYKAFSDKKTTDNIPNGIIKDPNITSIQKQSSKSKGKELFSDDKMQTEDLPNFHIKSSDMYL